MLHVVCMYWLRFSDNILFCGFLFTCITLYHTHNSAFPVNFYFGITKCVLYYLSIFLEKIIQTPPPLQFL